MRDGLILETIQHRMKSRWFWTAYLRKQGLMKQPKPFNSEEYAERWLEKIQNRTHTSTGNRFGEILTRSGNFINAGLTVTHPTGARAARYKLRWGGCTSNYYDPAFDVS